jgi:hypothetical protein
LLKKNEKSIVEMVQKKREGGQIFSYAHGHWCQCLLMVTVDRDLNMAMDGGVAF